MSYFGLNYVTFLVLLLCNMEIYGNYHFYTFFYTSNASISCPHEIGFLPHIW